MKQKLNKRQSFSVDHRPSTEDPSCKQNMELQTSAAAIDGPFTSKNLVTPNIPERCDIYMWVKDTYTITTPESTGVAFEYSNILKY